MADGTTGRALVVYAAEPPTRTLVATGGPSPLASGPAIAPPRPRDRRRPGRLPDALVRGLLLDRLA
jgi:hypothetical protein